jgi:vitamin B12 transporter
LKPSAVVAAFLAAVSPFVDAQTPEDEIVVTAARLPQPRSQTLQPVTIITADDIARAGQQTLVEVLQALGGVQVVSNGGFGQPSGVFMRGGSSTQTLVLVDGMKMASATTGSTALENIPLSQIERIEVVPGQLSSLYGSDAVGGVIQIFTKSGRYSSGTSASAGIGSYGTYSANAGINRLVGEAEFSLNLGYFDTAGFDATKPSSSFHDPDKDGYKNGNFSGKVAKHLNQDNEVGVTAFYSNGWTHFDTGNAVDDINHQTLSAYSLYSRNRFGPWESLLKVGQTTDDIVTTGAFPGFVRTRQPQATWQNNFKLGPGTAIAGVEYLEQHVSADPAFVQDSRRIGSAFGGYSGEAGAHAWQANVRQDRNSQFGIHTTGLLGYAYRVTSELKFRFGASTAFRAPTFNDLYSPFGANPDLRPERAFNREVGVIYQEGSSRFSATYFNNRIADLIVLDPVTFIPLNVDEAKVEGIEIGYETVFEGFRVNAQITVQDPVDEATGSLLQRRARDFGSLSLRKASGSWTFGAEVIASGARFDRANEVPDSRMHGYAILNLSVIYSLNREWSVRGRWNNVFDRDYELAQGFNTPGSNVFVSVQYQPM